MNTEYLSKSDVVANGIRELIQNGEFLPGSVLRQRDLADRFRVSPTPVREALRQLETEGFVTNELHRGATVARTEDSGPEENRLIRAQLESLAVDLAATKATDEDLRNLSELLEDLDSRSADDPARGTLDRRFHFAIYECARSPMLLSLLNLLWHSLEGSPHTSTGSDESNAHHRELLDALNRRDGKAAAKCTRRHIMERSA